MSTAIRYISLLPVVAVLSACSIVPQKATVTASSPPTATQPADTPTSSPSATATQTKTSTITLTPTISPTSTESPLPTALQDIPLQLGQVSLVIPAGLATSAELETTDETEWPAANPSIGPMPEHWVITLQGYALKNTNYSPVIIIFHANEFADFDDSTHAIINALKSYIGNPGSALPPAIMISEFAAEISPVSTTALQGVRYLSIFNGAGYMPITNLDLLYYYEGLTSDREYYVSAILQANAPMLADDALSPVPSGGVPFPDPIDNASWRQYLSQVTSKMNSSPRTSLTPQLATLDSLIRSIRISSG